MSFISLKYGSSAFEEIYGLGLQYTVWNFKGRRVPIISSEGGIGRGLRPVTRIANIEGGQGGNPTTTYSASYSHITSDKRAFVFNTSALGYIDFTEHLETKAVFWHT